MAVALAESQGVTIWGASEIDDVPAQDLDVLIQPDSDEWLAFTLRIRARHLIVYNSSLSLSRTNSVLMHEMAHIMLGHQLSSAGITDEGYLMPVTYDQEQEDEANWFGGTLLLPRPALLTVRKAGLSDEDIMTRYGVSLHMLRWRLRMTGVDYQLARAGN